MGRHHIPQSLLLLLLGVLCSASYMDSKMHFVQRIPNGESVNGILALGHVNPSGGGKLSAFGEAFKKAGFKWTMGLCLADSDGDGRTNGQELGDPCCVWNAATQLNPADPPTFKDNVTNPSDPDDIVAAEILEQWVCGYHLSSSSSSSSSSAYYSVSESVDSEGDNPMQSVEPGNSGGSGSPFRPISNSTDGVQSPSTPSSGVTASSGGVLVAMVSLLYCTFC